MGQDRAGHKVQGRIDWPRVWRDEARRAILWLPVLMGGGIWLYFGMEREPDPRWCALAGLPVATLASGLARRARWVALALCLGLTAFGSGFGLAVLAAHRAEAPALAGPIEETIEGRVLELSKAASGAPRLLLDRVVIYGLDPRETPARVRVTLLAADRAHAPRPGVRIRVFAKMLPPGEPVEPGAFDFRLRAYFEQLGAVGYARGAALILPVQPPSGPLDAFTVWLAERRLRLADGLEAALPGPPGAFAAALVVGDRSGIEEADAEALRVSNLAHLLAISGLHMGLLTGLVFAGLRLVLAAMPVPGTRARKTAAVGALAAGLAYLLLSGATVATQRAFVMMAVAFVAVLLDRPAITLRGLALAAAVVLAIRPMSLMDVGFQMSFAATAALVAGWEELRRRRLRREAAEGEARRPRRGWVRLGTVYVAGLVFTSVIAGAATAPYAAYHFNRIAPYGLERPALGVMGAGIEWVLEVAHWVAALPGAVRPVPVAAGPVLPLITVGGLWLFLWRGRWRVAGLGGMAAALALWGWAPDRPDILIAPGGRLVGVMGPEGRALDHGRAQSFAAETWLRRDGDGADQKAAAGRPGMTRGKGWVSAELENGWRLEVVHSKLVAPGRAEELCRERVLVILRYGPPHEGSCRYLGAADLARLGAVAVWAEEDGLRIEGAAEARHGRVWSGRGEGG
jgi:competence protein ComEC